MPAATATSPSTFTNPVMFADVPDPDVTFDGTYYYMVSTTMYYAPSVPIMRSTDLVHWSIVGYTAPILADTDELALRNGKNAYAKGTWAASIRYHDGTYYVSVGSLTTGKTYIYSTKSIEKGPWTTSVLDGYAHDQSLLFDGDDVYLVYGGGALDLRKLKRNGDGTFAWDGAATRIVDDANVGQTAGLNAEGSHAYTIGDYYYVFMIEWPTSGIRQEVVWRSKSLTPQSDGGAWEGKIVFSQKATVEGQSGDGAAQGGVVQAADGQWYAMLFQDEGPVGRSPQLAKVTWSDDGWPQYQLDATSDVPAAAASADPSTDPADTVSGIVSSDEFDSTATKPGYWNSANDADLVASAENANNGSNLKLQWQWNHNPDNRYWSLTDRPGYLRLTTGSLVTSILDARNTLTQRTYGPTSSGAIKLDVSHMKDGDVAGISAYQQKYGYVAVEMKDGAKSLVMRRADRDGKVVSSSTPVPLSADTVYLRADADYTGFANKASFAWSLDGTSWSKIGDQVGMEYNLAQFVGYRFAIFDYATTTTGGYVDVDWFHASDEIGQGLATTCTGSSDLVSNGGFESGSVSPWTGNGAAKLALTTDDKASGTTSVSVTGREKTGDGPRQDVALEAGVTYQVSAKVKYTTGPATKQFNVTVQDANYKAYIMASKTVTKGEWTTITGSYTVPSSGLDLASAHVFVETVWTGSPDATNDLMDFLVDDVSVTGPGAFDGGVLANGGFEAGSVEPWTGNGTAQLAVTAAAAASGSCGVDVTGRTKTGDGPLQSVADKVTAGATYDVAAKVRYTSGPATKQFNVTIEDKSKAYIMASTTVTKGKWATISGSYTIPATGFDVGSAKVFVETVWTGTPDATDDLMDFSVDDVAMTARATTPTHPAGDAAPAKTVGNANPLMDYQYGADPWAMVYDGRVYEYMTGDGSYIDADGNVVQAYETDGDGNVKDNSYGKIQTINVISSSDLVNWRNEGAIKVAGSHGAATWASNSWAPAATHKTIDGKEKFFLYFANSGGGIGVLTSDSPTGPWKDPIGKPIVSSSTPGTSGVVWMFDPAVLVDDDGSAYLYFGGGVPSTNGTSSADQTDHPKSTRVIKLGDDMVSTVGSAETIDAPGVFEDSGINKIGDTYYYSYCTNFSHSATIDGHEVPTGTIAYMTSKNPMGPFTYQGTILANPGSFFGAGGNNHHAMFEFKDQWYITYHAQTVQTALVKGGSLDKEHGYRSTQIDTVTVADDGSIEHATGTYRGVDQVGSLDPFQEISAATIAWDSGIQDAYDADSGIRVAPKGSDSSGDQVLTNVDDGEWTALSGVDFGDDGAARVSADVRSRSGGTVQVRLDAVDGDVVGTLDVPAGGDDADWTTVSVPLTKTVTGTHDVFFTFAGEGDDHLFDVASWRFVPAATAPQITGISVADGDTVSGKVTFTVDLGGEAKDVKYTYVELNKGSGQTWVTDNTKAAGSTNAGLHPTLVVDTTALANGAYGLKIDAVGTNGKTTEKKVSFTINNPPRLSFVTPKDGATVSGKMPVTVDLGGQGLKAYNLRVDSAGLSYAYEPKAGEQTFTWDSTTVADGVHTLLATATDTAGNKTTITEKVMVANTPAWDAKAVYTTGDRVSFDGSTWLASWWTQNQKPGDVTGPWQEIATTSDGTAVWTASRIFSSGDVAVYQGVTYRAQWWTRNQKPGDPNGPWEKA
ncbi:hypothetical protein GCM10023221_19420 [Luteimicrobium xylanilyticum]|uniref:Xylan 1,4-beta-xylosidase n=1 Tax=Luteimicrobium xylanilyticum TaxID=1133546 RepID=A0A5P9Q6T7_9MICO|nr:family 43 glycosylhydrolase [Luteimicrobium xylanilyticum]QFU97124.1 Xylan 1,4-beta-xylosidase [Luteimicrobium xylanilyticum]